MFHVEREGCMTIIAAKKYHDRIEIASDGRSMSNQLIIEDEVEKITEKIGAYNDILIGASGHAEICEFFKYFCLGQQFDVGSLSIAIYFDFLAEFHRHMGVSYNDENVYLETIFIQKTNGIIFKSEGCFCHEVSDFCAIGRGEEIALGALNMNATPKEAVKIVCKYISTCGGKIQNYKIPVTNPRDAAGIHQYNKE